jgi:hypothetical protein
LKDWALAHGETPSRRQLNADVSMPSDGIYRIRFGSYGAALKIAGLVVKKPIPGKLCKERRNASHKGKRSFNWRGGRIKDTNGYIYIWNPDHPNANSGRRNAYVAEHRMVMSNFIGRKLRNNETVHHKNGNREDNRIENLELWTSNHPSGQRVQDIVAWAKAFLSDYGYTIHDAEYKEMAK